MNTAVGILALLLTGSAAPAPAKDSGPLLAPSSETVMAGSVACGAMLCTDTYRFRCPAKSRIATAVITDNDGLGDNISVTIVGVSPVAIRGASEQEITPANGPGSGDSVSLTRPTAGPMDTYVMVSNLTNIQVAYLLDPICLDANLDPLTPNITLLQDE
jgi:hypothetical protein